MSQEEKKTAMILTAEEREAVTCYNENVILLPMMYKHKVFLTVHNIPVQKYEKEIDSILEQLFLFESVMDKIQDRRTRVVVRCHYALGMTVNEIAFFLNMSNGFILNRLKAIIPSRSG